MITDEETEYERENPDFLFELANIRQAETGLPMIIWIQEKGNRRYGPRMKVAKSHSRKPDVNDAVSVSIEEYPQIKAGGILSGKDMKVVREFILLNMDLLLDYWHGRIGVGAALSSRLKRCNEE